MTSTRDRYKPTGHVGLLGEKYDERTVYIGDYKTPIMTCRADEVDGFFNSDFYRCLEAWKRHHAGFSIGDEVELIESVTEMELYYQNNFESNNMRLKAIYELLHIVAQGKRIKG
jgi:hypothetical protein